jgi:hypothetical protein
MFATIPLPTVFLLYVGTIATIVAVTLVRTLSARGAAAGLCVLAIWLFYAAALGYLGVVSDQSLPVPGIFILLTPIIVFVSVVLVRSPVGGRLASSIPLALLIGLQAFRIGVELALHRLWELGSVPKLMTLGSGNVEILIGLSAPLFAWIATRGAEGRRIALVWNVVGLVSLLNVAARAVLTAPGPLNLVHGDVLNTALGTFPYTFIPGFMAPLAMMLHVLTFRALRATSQRDKPAFGGIEAAVS